MGGDAGEPAAAVMAEQAERFGPYALLEALERHRVSYVVVGALGRVLHGSGEVTDSLDICPSLNEESLRRLELALDDLDAQTRDSKRARVERDLVRARCSSSPRMRAG
jgi:hypothetical protein